MITAEKRQRQEFIKIINKLKNRYNFCVGYFSLKHKPSQKAVPFFQLQRNITNLEHKKNSPQETENDAGVCQIKLTDFN